MVTIEELKDRISVLRSQINWQKSHEFEEEIKEHNRLLSVMGAMKEAPPAVTRYFR